MDLQDELAKRKTWFFETQLRRLNYDTFRGVTPTQPGPLLDLIAEDEPPPPGQIGSKPVTPRKIYKDSRQPVWTAKARAQHDAFDAGFLGRMGDWLSFVDPLRLARALDELRDAFEQSRFGSEMDLAPQVKAFGRSRQAFTSPDDKDAANEGVGQAISRIELAIARPWLIPELYDHDRDGSRTPDDWLTNLEAFCDDYERELVIAVGGIADTKLPFDADHPTLYRELLELMAGFETQRSAGDAVKVRLLSIVKKPNEDEASYAYEPAIRIGGAPMTPVAAYKGSRKAPYWTGAIVDALRECVVLKANSDMGLCQIVRVLYRYGSLPSTLGTDDKLTWRTHPFPAEDFDAFFAAKAADPALKGNATLERRLVVGRERLRAVLETAAAHPRASAPAFSPIAGEVIKQGLLSYKFWFDEKLRALDNGELNKVKKGVGVGEADTEMEFWSENHYIMFASSEYLLGQLWEHDTFQPGRLFLKPDDTTGRLTGAERRDRGRARVLKWLNNRLLFGWMEFNSSGYYREHLWAILNLVDFALDEEVRTKATMVVDLMLFDVVRYLQRGAMGAPGGRSQFKSRNSGWDNGLGDVVEMLLGSRGVFNEGNAQIGASFASSMYKVPDVLLEIGAHPPDHGFVDRSRVSITFDESPKYGITWSQKSKDRDSRMAGYQAMRDKHYAFLEHVNAEIERTHNGYTRMHDDTVFFWGMSAFFNKQVVRNTLRTVDAFGLDNSPAFQKGLRFLIETLLPLVHRAEDTLVGGAIGALAGGPAGLVMGAGIGLFSPEILGDDLEGESGDDLSLFTEGSTRSRANILCYRSPDAMLGSIQNFRVGQLNFQSAPTQATLNASVNVFTTAGFAGFDISDVWAGLAGAVAGAAVGALVGGPIGAAAGAAVGAGGGIIANEALVMDEGLGDDADGPSWWTGSWALPMIAQHASAAILIYDYHDTQEFLAETGSHAWFPKSGFRQVVERRTGAYDNADFFLLDITDIGPKGFWLFGKVVHEPRHGDPSNPPEGYVGVFSNQRPEWLDKEFDIYERRLEEASEDAIDKTDDELDDLLDDLEDDDSVGFIGRQEIEIVVERALNSTYRFEIPEGKWADDAMATFADATSPIIAKHRDKIKEVAQKSAHLKTLKRTWDGDFDDLFKDRDWYVDGKNVWIVQVGSKAEFGSFDAFMDRCTSARVHLDDSGDMECSYDIPRPDGGSDRLSVAYGDGGRFGLNGGPLETDLYPRFENPFVRGGRVEWGQREYVIEWGGHALLHDFTDPEHPKRTVVEQATPEEAETIHALVIGFVTGDEEMERWSVTKAKVDVGCETLATDEVVAVGPAGEGTKHDVEWIYLDRPVKRDRTMTLGLEHTSTDDDEPEWSATFTVRALMGDRTVRDCALSFSSLHFEEERRSASPLPFTVSLGAWASWTRVPDGALPGRWLIAAHPPASVVYHGFDDLFVVDQGRLRHRRLDCAWPPGGWTDLSQGEEVPDLVTPARLGAVSDGFGRTLVVGVAEELVARWRDATGHWSEHWVPIHAYALVEGPGPLGFMVLNRVDVQVGPASGLSVEAVPSVFGSGAIVALTGADGHVYIRDGWQPGDAEPWTRLEVAGFSVASRVAPRVADGRCIVLGADGRLREADLGPPASDWAVIGPPDVAFASFAVAAAEATTLLAGIDGGGAAWTATRSGGRDGGWQRISGMPIAPDATPAFAPLGSGRAWLVACGTDGVLRFCDVSGAAPHAWQDVGRTEDRPKVDAAGGLVAIARATGQVELYARKQAAGLVHTWFS
jgi:hypothetical protein